MKNSLQKIRCLTVSLILVFTGFSFADELPHGYIIKVQSFSFKQSVIKFHFGSGAKISLSNVEHLSGDQKKLNLPKAQPSSDNNAKTLAQIDNDYLWLDEPFSNSNNPISIKINEKTMYDLSPGTIKSQTDFSLDTYYGTVTLKVLPVSFEKFTSNAPLTKVSDKMFVVVENIEIESDDEAFYSAAHFRTADFKNEIKGGSVFRESKSFLAPLSTHLNIEIVKTRTIPDSLLHRDVVNHQTCNFQAVDYTFDIRAGKDYNRHDIPLHEVKVCTGGSVVEWFPPMTTTSGSISLTPYIIKY